MTGGRGDCWLIMFCDSLRHERPRLLLGCYLRDAGKDVSLLHSPHDASVFFSSVHIASPVVKPRSPLTGPSSLHSITHLAPELSRIKPVLLYWIFIPLDLVCLVFQAAGGALSTASAGASQAGVDLALVGLSLQVVAMAAFGGLFADFLVRYFRSDAYRAAKTPPRQGAGDIGGLQYQRQKRLRLFFAGMGTAFVLILTRCCYRLVELRNGYRGELIRDEPLFIGLEGV